MSDVEKDPWQTETGLLENYEGTVMDAWFAKDPKRGANIIFNAKLETDVPTTPENVETWPCGSDWDSYDGGQTVEHPKGPDKGFNKNSGYGRLIDAALKLMSGEDLAKLRGRGSPKTAAVWLGTKWFFSTETKEYDIPDDKGVMQHIVSNKNFPSKFLGWVEITPGNEFDAARAGEVTPGSGSGAAGGTSGDPNNPLGSLSAEDAAAAKLAAKSLTHGEWADKVMAMSGVSDQLMIALADENGLYATLRASE